MYAKSDACFFSLSPISLKVDSLNYLTLGKVACPIIKKDLLF